MTWKIFKKNFLDRFFHKEMRDAKVGEFINLCQQSLSVLNYSLQFTKFFKYVPSFVSNPRDEMCCFLTRVSYDLVEEFNLAMFHDNMNISHLVEYAQQLQETRLRRKSWEDKKV